MVSVKKQPVGPSSLEKGGLKGPGHQGGIHFGRRSRLLESCGRIPAQRTEDLASGIVQLGDVADPGLVWHRRIELAVQQIEMAEVVPGRCRRHTGTLSVFHSRRKERNHPLDDGDALVQQLSPDCLGGSPLARAQVELFYQRT